MAVYQGARPSLSVRAGLRPRIDTAQAAATTDAPPARGPLVPARAADILALPRRRTRGSAAVRAGRRSNRVGIVLGIIAVAFLLAFFSLAQSMRVSATSYEIDGLILARDRLEGQLRDLRSDVNRLGKEPAIRKQALDLGLGQLGAPLVVEPR
jgi:hypothetical protein